MNQQGLQYFTAKHTEQTHYKVFNIKLAPRHGFLVQNRTIMRYTLIVAK